MINENNYPYYFIIGLPRSGSTVLAYILDSHSKIICHHEDNAYPDTDCKDRDIVNLNNKISTGFSQYLDSLRDDHEVIVTSRYYLCKQVKQIMESLNNSVKFIVLTRDNMHRVFQKSDGSSVKVPKKKIQEFNKTKTYLSEMHPEITFNISYNEILSSPEEIFSRLCGFIGVDYEPGMLAYGDFEHPHLADRGNVKTKLSSTIIGSLEKEKNACINSPPKGLQGRLIKGLKKIFS